MSDANLFWGGDLSASLTGDLATVSAELLGQQRVLRRLLTNPGDYLWQPTYGAGLGLFIGKPCNVLEIRSAIRSQIFQESVVARSPEPSIAVESADDGSIYVQINYVDSASGESQLLTFSVSA